MATNALEVTNPGLVGDLTAIVTQRPLTAAILVGSGVLTHRFVLRKPLDDLFSGKDM